MALSVALDIGGTFTDLVAFDDETGSLRARQEHSPRRPTCTDGIVGCLKKSGADLQAASAFVHGSTIAINTVIERSGARTALVTRAARATCTRSAASNRPEAYNIFFKRPVPLVPRSGRSRSTSACWPPASRWWPLTRRRPRRWPRRRGGAGGEAVAVCLLHAYANPRTRRRWASPCAPRCRTCLRLAVARDPARVPRVRAHVDDRR